MGFNIGLYSNQLDDYIDCKYSVARSFYFFVNSDELYGEQSILFQAANYYQVDLSALLKLVYISEADEDYIEHYSQDITLLLELLYIFRDKIKADSSFCNQTKYSWYYPPAATSYDTIKTSYEQISWEVGKPKYIVEKELSNMTTESLNPWKWYFEKGKIIEDLDNLIKGLECYKKNGVTKVCLTAS